MSRVAIPTKESEYRTWLTTFASVATANVTMLNMTSGQALALTGLATAYNAAYNDALDKKAASQGANGAKYELHAVSEEAFRAAARVINANGNIPTALKAELGISVTPDPSGPVTPPTALKANGFDTGFIKLGWKRNGNASRTTYIIECRVGDSPVFNYVDTTNKTRFMHMGQTPGVQVTYRVTAQRDDVKSMPSNLATVYGPEESSVVTLKRAA